MSSIGTAAIPAHWDTAWLDQRIRALAGVTFTVSFAETEAGYSVRYHGSNVAKFSEIVEGYPTDYLPTLRKRAIAKIVETRRAKVKVLRFGGMTLEMDPGTETRIAGAALYLQLAPDVQSLNWDASGEGDFVELSRDQVFALALAAGGHVQGVFDRAKALTDGVMAATSTEDAVFGQIETGWPGDA
jgi:hypothetical protein